MQAKLGSIVAPKKYQEIQVLNIFKEVLGRQNIGIDDNFFRVGGHSLLAIRLAGKISDRLGMPVNIRQLFEHPSVASLCAAIDNLSGPIEQWKHLLPVRRTGAGRPVFFVAGGDGGVGDMAFYSRLVDCMPNRPFYGLLSTDTNHSALLQPNVEQLSAAFIAEIKQIQPEGPYYLAGGCLGGVIAFEMARQLAAAGCEIGKVVMLDTSCPSAYLRSRHFIRYACARLRFHLRRLLGLEDNELDLRTRRIYERLTAWLPFAERDASPDHSPISLKFAATVLRYRPAIYPGRVFLISSKEFLANSPDLAWGKWAAGGVSLDVVPGDHWSYIREYFDQAGAAFGRAIEEPPVVRTALG